MKLTTIDKIKVMRHYLRGGKIEVRPVDEQNWYQVIGEPFWNWVEHEWRIVKDG